MVTHRINRRFVGGGVLSILLLVPVTFSLVRTVDRHL
jgi:hypothetical protein